MSMRLQRSSKLYEIFKELKEQVMTWFIPKVISYGGILLNSSG